MEKLSSAQTSFILGIISVVLGPFGCCCYGSVGVAGLVCGIIGLVQAKSASREIEANPGKYENEKQAKSGKVLSLIGLILSALMLLIFIVLLAVGTAANLSSPQDIENFFNSF